MAGPPERGLGRVVRHRRRQRRQLKTPKKRNPTMSYLVPAEFVSKMVDAGESKLFMSVRDTLIRAFMAGAILALAAVFAITITIQTGSPLLGQPSSRSASSCST